MTEDDLAQPGPNEPTDPNAPASPGIAGFDEGHEVPNPFRVVRAAQAVDALWEESDDPDDEPGTIWVTGFEDDYPRIHDDSPAPSMPAALRELRAALRGGTSS